MAVDADQEPTERCEHPGADPDSGTEALATFEQLYLRVVLKKWQLKFSSPEVRRAMGDLHERVADVARLRTVPGPAWAEARVHALGSVTQADLKSIESMYSTHNALSAVTLEFGSPEYRAIRRAGETLRPAGPVSVSAWPPPMEALLAKAKEAGADPSPELDNEAVMFREQERTRTILHEHARRRTRARLLYLLVPLMLALVIAFAWMLAETSQAGSGPGARAALAAVAGALGATLSGLFRVRDLLTRLSEVRAFRAVILVQPLVGAAFGLFLAAALNAGIVGIELPSGEDGAATLAVFGFIAGFSEPFALGIVQKVAGGTDGQKDAAAGPGAPATPA